MSTSVTVFANNSITGKNEELSTRIRKVWDYENYADEKTSYSFTIKTTDGDEVTLFVSMSQLEQLSEGIDTFIASAVDVPQPTGSDYVKSQAESEQGWSLA
jgi:predicted XRE-type DNA-binding protein